MERGQFSVSAAPTLSKKLLAWFDENRRDLPWRHTRDPYSIWVSEVMLQQTRVAVVLDRYRPFLDCFPTVSALARAAEANVLALWSGLGYYRRARMLHKAAQVVVAECDGQMPTTAASLRKLPGVGAYTSAAIASIAYGEAVAVVDGNVERVVQRIAGLGSESATGQTQLDRQIKELAENLLDPDRPGDHNQAMMELGATICLPRNPLCLQCPVSQFCETKGEHPTPQRARMTRQDAAYALALRAGATETEILLAQRRLGDSHARHVGASHPSRSPDSRAGAVDGRPSRHHAGELRSDHSQCTRARCRHIDPPIGASQLGAPQRIGPASAHRPGAQSAPPRQTGRILKTAVP